MKLTITVEEDKESDVRIERGGGGEVAVPSVEERPSEFAATSAGGPPEWLLAELEEGREAQEVLSGEALDAGPARASTDGVGLMHP